MTRDRSPIGLPGDFIQPGGVQPGDELTGSHWRTSTPHAADSRRDGATGLGTGTTGLSNGGVGTGLGTGSLGTGLGTGDLGTGTGTTTGLGTAGGSGMI